MESALPIEKNKVNIRTQVNGIQPSEDPKPGLQGGKLASM
jgi:hypothetical protein